MSAKNQASTVTTEDIQKAYLKYANIIEKYGDIYLPIFERLENELLKRANAESTLERAIRISTNTQIDTRIDTQIDTH